MNTKNKIVESNKEASQSSENTDTENTTVKEEVYSLMTVNEFREFYSITEEQLTDIQIEDFVIENNITQKELEKTNSSKGSFALSLVEDDLLFYSVRSRTRGNQVEVPLDDFIDNTQYIFIEFNVKHGDGVKLDSLIIDYMHMQLFYGGDPEGYNLCELTTDITEEDKKKINRDILTHINEDQVSNEAYKESSYEYTVV